MITGQLAAQLYSVREFLKTPADIAVSLKKSAPSATKLSNSAVWDQSPKTNSSSFAATLA